MELKALLGSHLFLPLRPYHMEQPASFLPTVCCLTLGKCIFFILRSIETNKCSDLLCWEFPTLAYSYFHAQALILFQSRPSLQMESPVISSISFHQCQRRAKMSPWHEIAHAHWGVCFGFYTVWRESSWHQRRAGGLRSSYLEAMLNGALTPVWQCCQTSQPWLTSRGTRVQWW